MTLNQVIYLKKWISDSNIWKSRREYEVAILQLLDYILIHDRKTTREPNPVLVEPATESTGIQD